LDWTGLEDRSHVIQHPYTEQIVVQKTEEELAQIAERKKESGRRLQEQAAKMRLKKLMDKEQELQYYKELRERLDSQTNKKEVRKILDAEDFDDENQLDKRMKDLEKSITKARKKDLGEEVEEEVAEAPTFPLLDMKDEDLDEEQKKEKKQQRLMKSNYDARQRAKAEKEKEKARIAEEERRDTEKRENDLEGWVDERRAARQDLLLRIKERDRLKADLGNRKSLANQMRMKTIANLASDNPTKKRRRGGDDDNFGADDADWAVYRQVQTGDASDDEEEEDLDAQLKTLEGMLLKHDPNFTEDSTREAQTDWTKSIVHAFLRGPYPFDPEKQRDLNQIHLNVERIRVPEVVFQPSIAGLDQAGIVEIAAGILNERLADAPYRSDILKDIFLTGGNTLFQGFEQRLRRELMAVLAQGEQYHVRMARDPVLDAWRGAAIWAGEAASRQSFVTRAEWAEKGGEYIKVSRGELYV
jgi:actin-related protein 5